jgi:hypothetical protein
VVHGAISAGRSAEDGERRYVRNLFVDKYLADYCQQKRAELEEAVRGWKPDELLATPEQEIIEYLVSTYSVTCPVLRPEDGESTEPEAVDLPSYSPIPGIAFGTRSQPLRSVPGTKIAITIPYDGDQEVFYRRPNPFQIGPSPSVDVRPGSVRITWQQAERDTPNADLINAYVEEQLAGLQHYLAQSERDLAMFNRDIAALAASRVAARKARLLEERAVVAKLRYPVKRRADASQYQVPLTRRVLMPQPRSKKAVERSEYQLGDAEFEDALKVLRHSRNALERSPSLTAELGEEQIRFILLVNLNAVFEGQAGGEVFNHKGKTDILIRVEDDNVFVGECKIWEGESKFTEAIDQLLSYLTWRDTKGTLLLFIRRLNVTAVIGKAVAAIEQHPNHVKTLPVSDPAGRYDFVMHAEGDPQKTLRMALLPFALGPVAPDLEGSTPA